MTPCRVYIDRFGIVTAMGVGAQQTLAALSTGTGALAPVSRFHPPEGRPLPVGQAPGIDNDGKEAPFTHRLARMAAAQLLTGAGSPPDAVVIGTTTGGMAATESLLRAGVDRPEAYRRHGAATVAADLAERFRCPGPVLTVSTACSSGAAALALAAALIRSGRARRVLAGGADALCRMTYYGFSSLQLIDPAGARPLDRDRRGMSVADGAALVMLSAEAEAPAAEILGAGLSCDAWHPAAPHPEGAGAGAAMAAALGHAQLSPADIDYLNLHGTGTVDNDLAEARAVRAVFGENMPALSSVKGACGHSLAASGAVEAVVAALAIRHGILPASTGCRRPDPALGLSPVRSPQHAAVSTVMSNAFGFGGSNAVLIAAKPDRVAAPPAPAGGPLHAAAGACITGAGATETTLSLLSEGRPCAGICDEGLLCGGFPPREVRRLRRLPKLALTLAGAAGADRAGAVFFGTGWGALTETDRFLTGLFASGERHPSPTDFVGSVHNAPAGQIARNFGARGANLTLTGETDAFEQALLAAELTGAAEAAPALVVGADEAHEKLSALFNPAAAGRPADGGGALLLVRGGGGPRISVSFLSGNGRRSGAVKDLIDALGDAGARDRFGAVLAGIPAGAEAEARAQLAASTAGCRLSGPVIDYRRWIGQFAAASAAAAVLACRWVAAGRLPAALCTGSDGSLDGRGILILGLGGSIAAMEVLPA